jgi:hypothetical protein
MEGFLWDYVKKGYRLPIVGSLAAGGFLASCELTDAQIQASAARCRNRRGLEAQILCAMNEVSTGITPTDPNALLPNVTENVCRHYGRCFKKVWEEMGGDQTLTGRVIPGGAGHSFNMVEGDGGTYYVDSYNGILIWCPQGT